MEALQLQDIKQRLLEENSCLKALTDLNAQYESILNVGHLNKSFTTRCWKPAFEGYDEQKARVEFKQQIESLKNERQTIKDKFTEYYQKISEIPGQELDGDEAKTYGLSQEEFFEIFNELFDSLIIREKQINICISITVHQMLSNNNKVIAVLERDEDVDEDPVTVVTGEGEPQQMEHEIEAGSIFAPDPVGDESPATPKTEAFDYKTDDVTKGLYPLFKDDETIIGDLTRAFIKAKTKQS